MAFLFAFSTVVMGCRDQKNATESEVEMNDVSEEGDIENAAEDVGNALETAAEETGEAVETAAEETANAAEEGWEEVKENTGTGTTDDK